MRGRLVEGVATLFPGYFALVMATCIVPIGAFLLGMEAIAWTLLAINLAAYGVLTLLTLARLAFFWPRLLADVKSHARGPGFFTLIAGTCVLGTQWILLAGARTAAWAPSSATTSCCLLRG